MCVIACTPPGEMLTDEILKKCWDDNDDGAGYMFSTGNELVIRKPFWKFEDLLEQYHKDAAEYGDYSPFVIHFRWATHGQLNVLNTHPHKLCGGKVGMVHNGIFADTPPINSGISDTVYFCRTVLAKRQPSQLIGRRFKAYLEDMIGANRVVFMDWTGKVSIVNDVMGDWVGEVWFSNLNFLVERKWIPSPHTQGAWELATVPKTEDEDFTNYAEKTVVLPPACPVTGELEVDEQTQKTRAEVMWDEWDKEQEQRKEIEIWSKMNPPKTGAGVAMRAGKPISDTLSPSSNFISPGTFPIGG